MIADDSYQVEPTSVISRATALVRSQRDALRGLLEEARMAHARLGAEYREIQTKLSEVAGQIESVRPFGAPSGTECDQTLQLTALRELDWSLRQRQEWLAERIVELQTATRKIRSVLQQMDDSIGYLTSEVEALHQHDDSSAYLSKVRLLQAQEDERQRLAREIHDGPAQVLANAIFELEYCERLWDKNPQQMRRELSRLKQDLREALADIRYFLWDLRPVPLAELGLGPVLRRYLEEYQSRFGIRVRFDLDALERLPGPQELAIFRIIQEALQNTRKHSGASEVSVEMSRDTDSLTIHIRDNGKGFNVKETQGGDGQHFGLRSMSERAQLIGGELTISSSSSGTTITLVVPLGNKTNGI